MFAEVDAGRWDSVAADAAGRWGMKDKPVGRGNVGVAFRHSRLQSEKGERGTTEYKPIITCKHYIVKFSSKF